MSPLISKTKFIAHTALYLAIAILLPIAFHAFGIAGRIFLPMHIPVLLAGFLIGPYSGLVVGLLAPVISHLLTGMPPTYAVPLMSVELPIYGFIAGLTYYKLNFNIYISLIISMIIGRLFFGLSLYLLGMFIDLPYNIAEFFAIGGAVVTGIPGIIIQIILIPILVTAIKRTKTK
ncbi:MAG: ECF transporter S component [candidate division Zixibacteria bacterium]|nr:ECF transporter S component [candidate division Zixibacteria bacterium]